MKPEVPDQGMPTINDKPVFGPVRPPQILQTEVIGNKVSEVFDSDSPDAESGDMRPHRKPDSDPEDSDEDATMVNRSKPRAPVYVRDMMRMIQDDKEPARFELGMKHAAPLIRRKIGFGNEVKDHANELLSLLSNLQDPFATPNFDELRLQTMIAVFISDPVSLGPWMSHRVFSGEFSIAQRCMMLSTLGLGGRELAGLQSQDDLNPTHTVTEKSFPSKQLPPLLHALYKGSGSSVKRLNAASADVERSLVRPMALRAADQQTADLNAVKVRTFSSRITSERTKRKPAANKLAQILGPSIFHPLLTRYQQERMSYGSASVWSSTPILLVTLVKTLAILLHAAGPATTDLRDITTVFWSFLHSLRVAAVGDIAVLSSVLFALLTLLEINTTTTSGQQVLADEYAKELMETQQWTEVVFERLGGGDVLDDSTGRSEEAKVRALAAGVLVKTREVVETSTPPRVSDKAASRSKHGTGDRDERLREFGLSTTSVCAFSAATNSAQTPDMPRSIRIQKQARPVYAICLTFNSAIICQAVQPPSSLSAKNLPHVSNFNLASDALVICRGTIRLISVAGEVLEEAGRLVGDLRAIERDDRADICIDEIGDGRESVESDIEEVRDALLQHAVRETGEVVAFEQVLEVVDAAGQVGDVETSEAVRLADVAAKLEGAWIRRVADGDVLEDVDGAVLVVLGDTLLAAIPHERAWCASDAEEGLEVVPVKISARLLGGVVGHEVDHCADEISLNISMMSKQRSSLPKLYAAGTTTTVENAPVK
nr:dna replication checkpoint protein tel2 [Quercus suber]